MGPNPTAGTRRRHQSYRSRRRYPLRCAGDVRSGARDDPWSKLAEVEALYHKIESHARLVVFDGSRHGACSRTDPQRYDATLLELLSRGCDRPDSHLTLHDRKFRV